MKTTVDQELQAIEKDHGGILRPADVVEWARTHQDSALHSKFEWDDAKAAHGFRLWQAREIIRVVVTVEQSDTEPVRAYVSLGTDREQPGGGYRKLFAVLRDPKRRQELLAQALEELQAFETKYNRLRELAAVFEEAKRVRRRASIPTDARAQVTA